MSAMQRVEDSETSLKVPKLKLKLTKPFQNPVESEQSSTESDSDSENENDNDENVSHEQDNTLIDAGSNGKGMDIEQLSFPQPKDEAQQYPSNAINNNISFDESLNESGSSAQNTSTDSGGKSTCVEHNEYQTQTQQHLFVPPQDELNQLSQLQNLPEIQADQEQTANMVQTNIALDNITNINVRSQQSKPFIVVITAEFGIH